MGSANWRIFLIESQTECLRLVRSPSFAVPIILFPLMFYALFGLVLGGHGPAAAPDGAARTLATYIAFGSVAPGLFGIGVTVVLDRGLGILEQKRALLLPAGIYLAAKLVTAAVFATAVALVLMLLSAAVGKVVLELAQWASLFVLSVLGAIPFCRLGVLVGGW